jgi:NTE family protein
MGADVVIAVDLSSGIVGRGFVVKDARAQSSNVADFLRRNLGWLRPSEAAPRRPSVLDVIASSLDVMQVRITRSRMAGEPPDVIVAPRIADIGLLDFHRADEAVREGERAMTAALGSLGILGVDAAVEH